MEFNFNLRKFLPFIIIGFFILISNLKIFEFLIPFIVIAILIIFIIKSIKKKINLNTNKSNFNNKIYDYDSFINNDKINKIVTNIMQKNKLSIIFTVVIIILGVWLLFSSITIIDAGYTGVYSLFGKVGEKEISSGIHLVNPLARITKMSIRTEEYTMSIAVNEGNKKGDDSITALTKEGLEVSLDITTLFHLEEAKASDVYKNVGLNYEKKVIRPEIRTTIRDVIALYSSKEIYSDKRQEANEKIKNTLKDKLEQRGIFVEETLLRNVSLPQNLALSIQQKLQAEQEAQKYEFILDKEKKEKERKVIEAEGQRDAQKIINESLSPNYLYYLYIKELKDRQGTIYVPTSPTTGMPLFRDIGK